MTRGAGDAGGRRLVRRADRPTGGRGPSAAWWSERGSRVWLVVLLVLASAMTAMSAGCGGRVRTPTTTVLPPFEGPSVLRGTIGSTSTLIGARPQLISGLGVVVGVEGRGGPLPEPVEATLVRELSLREGARGVEMFFGTPFEGESARSFLRRSDVAVVYVLALLSPGSPEASRFDVLVVALSNTGVESLSGGHLWRTTLRLGMPTLAGGRRTREIAYAEGPVYVNPFASGRLASETEGRVIGGGVITNPLDLAIRLNVPSARRTRAIEQLLNSRFGGTPVDRGKVASGRLTGEGEGAASIVRLTIPWSYKDRPQDFINLVSYSHPSSLGREDRYAHRYARALVEEPGWASQLAWALEAIGEASLPHIRDLYDWPDAAPRMAALRVGARLGDVAVVEHLIREASADDTARRVEAVELLGAVGTGARVDAVLERMAAADEVMVRVAAYESMARRASQRELLATLERSSIPPGVDAVGVLRDWTERAKLSFRGGLDEGLRRDLMPGGFVLDRVPHGEALVYVRQQGVPGLVLFGESLSIKPGAVLRLEDGDLVLSRPDAGGPVRVRYRHTAADWLVTVPDAPATLPEFIAFLATPPTPEEPERGLGMTFGDVVAVVSGLQESGAIDAQWQVQRNDLRDGMLDYGQPDSADRPELEPEGGEPGQFRPVEELLRGGEQDGQDEVGGQDERQGRPAGGSQP